MRTILLIIAVITINWSFCFPVEIKDFFASASVGDIKGIRSWIDSGGDVNAEDSHGNTALLLASENANIDVINLLMSKGAEINRPNNYGYTPLFAAVTNGHADVIALLIQNGADLREKNKYMSSPEDFIFAKGYPGLNEYLAYLKYHSSSSLKGPNSLPYIRGWQKNRTYPENDTKIADNNITDGVVAEEKADESVDPEAQFVMGTALIETDPVVGRVLIEKAAESGNMEAMYDMGRYYTAGSNSVNFAKGVAYLKSASDLGHTGASVLYGKAYLFGEGVARNPQEASRYFNLAYNAGDPDGAYYLAAMQYYGMGVPENKEAGMSGIIIAAVGGSLEARQQTKRFATEGALTYIKRSEYKDRALLRAYMLSQGGMSAGTQEDCDTYDVTNFFSPDYGIDKLTVCFPTDALPSFTLNVYQEIEPVYKEYLLNYAENAPMKFEVTEK